MDLPENIETERLVLRRWRESDRRPFAAMNADPRVMEYFPSVLLQSESDAIAERISEHFDEHGFGLWAAEVKQGEPFIGFIGLQRPRFEARFTPCVEIGWRLAHDAWGRGLAPEGAAAVLAFAFNSLGLDEVVSMTAVGNHRSRRVMEKIGMTESPEEEFDHPLVASDHWLCRHVLYRIGSES